MTIEIQERIDRLIDDGELAEAAMLAFDNGVEAIIHAVQQAYAAGYGDHSDWHSE